MKRKMNIKYCDKKTALCHIIKYDGKRALQWLVIACILLFFALAPDTELYKSIIELLQ